MHDGILANHLLFRRMHNKKRMFKQKPQSDSGKFLRSSRHVIFANRSSSTNFEAAKTDTDIANHMKINIQQRKVSLSIFIKPKRRRRWGSAQKKNWQNNLSLNDYSILIVYLRIGECFCVCMCGLCRQQWWLKHANEMTKW